MKICSVICEYNPFHNGHRYLLNEIKKTGRFDQILCIMSGHFTQRGEIAVMDAYTRARHALLGGADAVIELPTVFATSSAERFASGAIRILSSIPEVKAIAFGTECATKDTLDQTASLLLEEPPLYREALREALERGMSYAQARELAFAKTGKDSSLLRSPNDILAVEYTKAIFKQNAPIERLCIPRVGQGYRETAPVSSFASASSIRANREDSAFLKGNVPSFVLDDLPVSSYEKSFQIAAMTALSLSSTEELRQIANCGEGLEFALKKGDYDYNALLERVTSKRYPKSRIRRILLHNLLKITESDVQNALNAPLFLHLLAAKNSSMLSALGQSSLPLFTKGRDLLSLPPVARRTREIDLFAEQIYEICSGLKIPKKIFQNQP
ncbi:MAG: nucleotidyltransferase family protein [Clostridia bacterium]|nr:nucleotidyltransferase family protein [Clostridia bacterium]